MKLWGGRFAKDSDKLLDKFNSSISFDSRLYKHDIIGSIAYAKMLGNKKIISKEDSEIIQKSLAKILSDIENGDIALDMGSEDIHTNIEQILIKRIGSAGKKLHTGRSRNDQVCLDLRMYLKEETLNIKSLLKELGETLILIAEKNLDTIMPGYTHLQKAQPVTFAHHMMAYFQMFKRDIERLDDCFKRIDVMPLGSGALAGTTYPIDRKMLAEELGFSNITENSMDAVSDRDFVIELSSCISLIIMHLSRLSEEVILWSTHEFNFIELDDAFSTGSSIMPQKKNPDAAELVRGKTGRIYGNLISLLTTMKSLPLSYNKDMQEDKEAIFDSVDNIKICLKIFSKMLSTMKINREKMYLSAQGGYSNATDVADYLVKNGLPFREAHEITGKLVIYCIKQNKAIDELSIEEFKNISSKFENDIYNEIQLKKCISERNIPGGPSKEAIETSIKNARSFLSSSK